MDNQGEARNAKYQSGRAQLFFSNRTQNLLRGSYGSEVQVGKKQGKLFGNFLYDKNNNENQYQQNVKKYIQSYDDPIGKLNIFKNSLRQTVQNAKQNVQTFTLQQIAEFYPWVMSCQVLIEPFRSIIYAIHRGISPEKIQQIIYLSDEQINQGVNYQVLQSLKNLKSTLGTALSALSNKESGVVGKTWKQWVQKSSWVGKAVSGTVSVLKEIFFHAALATLTFGVGTVAWAVYHQYQQFQKRKFQQQQQRMLKQAAQTIGQEDYLNLKTVIYDLMRQIVHNLRCYGQIVINFHYLKKTAQKKVVNGVQLYFYAQFPSILIGIRDSFPKIYLQQSDVLTLIQPGQFNINFLRKLLRAQLTRFSGRLMSNVDRQISMTQQTKKPWQQFQNKYLKISDRKIQRYDLQKLEKQRRDLLQKQQKYALDFRNKLIAAEKLDQAKKNMQNKGQNMEQNNQKGIKKSDKQVFQDIPFQA